MPTGIESFRLGERPIGAEHPCLVIGEVAQSHDGSLGMGHAFVDAIANAGADAVKFQTHIAAAESTPAEPWRTRFSPQDATRYDYWRRMEFTEEQWRGLAQHALDRGLIFLSSPFSVEAVELLERVGVPGWKIASGEVNNQPMLDRIAQTKLPVLLSSGMSNLDELDWAMAHLRGLNLPVLLFQCTTAYPCPPEKVGLNLIPFFQDRYRCPVGLSDHSGTVYAGLAAATLGVQAVEVHVTFSREMFGPDVPASLTTAELRQLVQGIRFIEAMRAHPVNKDELAGEMAPLRAAFTKSVVARADLEAGTILAESMLVLKKPGGGIPGNKLPELIGRRLRRNVRADEPILERDLGKSD